MTSSGNNSPNTIRNSFIYYIKHSFPYKGHWVHPTTGQVFEHELIKKRLNDFKDMDRDRYRALWYLFTTQSTRAFIADQMNFSAPTIKRRWDSAVDTIIFMLLFPDLIPENFKLFTTTC
jgi:hypothetical protein